MCFGGFGCAKSGLKKKSAKCGKSAQKCAKCGKSAQKCAKCAKREMNAEKCGNNNEI